MQIETWSRQRKRERGEGGKREKQSRTATLRTGREAGKNAEGQSSASDRLITYKLDSCRRREAHARVSTCRRIAPGPRAAAQIYIITPRSAFFAKRNNTSSYALHPAFCLVFSFFLVRVAALRLLRLRKSECRCSHAPAHTRASHVPSVPDTDTDSLSLPFPPSLSIYI